MPSVVNPTDKNRVTFDDVAGVDEEKEELEEKTEKIKSAIDKMKEAVKEDNGE